MSSASLRLRLAAFTALCLSTVTQTAVAQAPTVAEQAARVARLTHLRDVAAAVEDSMDRAVGTRWPPDTIRTGPLTVLTDRAGAALVGTGLNLAWQQLAPTLGNDTSVLKSEWLFIYFRDTPARPRAADGSCKLERGVFSCMSARMSTRPPVRSQVHVGWSAPLSLPDAKPEDVANEVQRLVGERFGEAWERSFMVNEHRMSRWPGGYSPIPLPRDSAFRGEIYVEVVTGGSQATHRCYDGDIPACRAALGLDVLADPVTAWYTAAQRVLLVKHLEPRYRNWYGRGDVMSRCTEGRDDASCLAFLRGLAANPTEYSVIWPLSSRARQSVMLVAVMLGGSGAYARLVTDRSTTPGGRLAAAARVPLDSVVALWRAQVIAARPLSPEVAGGTQWATLFWAVVFGVLALGSTKWRSA